MSARTTNGTLIGWLEATSRWFRAESERIESLQRRLRSSIGDMKFTAPAGDRVRSALDVVVRSLGSISREYAYMAGVCSREATRLREVDRRMAQLRQQSATFLSMEPVSRLVLDTPQPREVIELSRYEADPSGWADVHVPGEPISDEPEVLIPALDDGTDLGDRTMRASAGASIAPGGLDLESLGFAPLGFFVRPVSRTRYVLDLGSMRATARVCRNIARACVAHRGAVDARLGDVPRSLRAPLQRRLARTRTSCRTGLDRNEVRAVRQADLLERRAATPGLIDDRAPVLGPLPLPAIPPATNSGDVLVDGGDGEPGAADERGWTDLVQHGAERMNHQMSVLVRRLPVIYGSLPPGWWRPIGSTGSNPPSWIWGSSIPPHLRAVVETVVGPTPEALPWPPLPLVDDDHVEPSPPPRNEPIGAPFHPDRPSDDRLPPPSEADLGASPSGDPPGQPHDVSPPPDGGSPDSAAEADVNSWTQGYDGGATPVDPSAVAPDQATGATDTTMGSGAGGGGWATGGGAGAWAGGWTDTNDHPGELDLGDLDDLAGLVDVGDLGDLDDLADTGDHGDLDGLVQEDPDHEDEDEQVQGAVETGRSMVVPGAVLGGTVVGGSATYGATVAHKRARERITNWSSYRRQRSAARSTDRPSATSAPDGLTRIIAP